MMNDDFCKVKTWQGHIMVSAALLPATAAERLQMYPEQLEGSCNDEDDEDEPVWVPSSMKFSRDKSSFTARIPIPPVVNPWSLVTSDLPFEECFDDTVNSAALPSWPSAPRYAVFYFILFFPFALPILLHV